MTSRVVGPFASIRVRTLGAQSLRAAAPALAPLYTSSFPRAERRRLLAEEAMLAGDDGLLGGPSIEDLLARGVGRMDIYLDGAQPVAFGLAVRVGEAVLGDYLAALPDRPGLGRRVLRDWLRMVDEADRDALLEVEPSSRRLRFFGRAGFVPLPEGYALPTGTRLTLALRPRRSRRGALSSTCELPSLCESRALAALVLASYR